MTKDQTPDVLTVLYTTLFPGGPTLLLCVCANEEQVKRALDAHVGQPVTRADYIKLPNVQSPNDLQ